MGEVATQQHNQQAGQKQFYAKFAIRASLAVFIASVFSGLFAYAVRMVLARVLSVEEYGLFYAVFSFVSFFLLFRDFGLGTALIKYVAEFDAKHEYDRVKSIIVGTAMVQLGISTIIAIVLFSFSGIFAEYYFKTTEASLLIKLFVFYVYFSLLAILVKATLAGLRKNAIAALVGPVKNFSILCLILIFAYFQLGVLIPLLSQIIAWAIIFVVFSFVMVRFYPFFKHKVVNLKEHIKLLFGFGIPSMLTNIGEQIIGQADTLILTYLTTLEKVGIYNVVLPAALLFLLFGRSVSDIIFPLFSELWAKKEQSKIVIALSQIYKYSFIITSPVMLFFFVFGDVFIQLSFGAKYLGGLLAFRILLIGVLLYVVALVNNQSIASLGYPKVVTKIISLAAVINVVLNVMLIPVWGIQGAALATTVSYAIILFLGTGWLSKKLNIPYPWFLWIKLFILGSVYLAVVFGLRYLFTGVTPWIVIPAVLIISLAVYVVLLFVSGIVTWVEVKSQYALLERVFLGKFKNKK